MTLKPLRFSLSARSSPRLYGEQHFGAVLLLSLPVWYRLRTLTDSFLVGRSL
jgi:hypothetical protein